MVSMVEIQGQNQCKLKKNAKPHLTFEKSVSNPKTFEKIFCGLMRLKWNFTIDIELTKSIIPTVKHDDGSFIVWSCFAASYSGHLIVIRGTMNSAFLQKILLKNGGATTAFQSRLWLGYFCGLFLSLLLQDSCKEEGNKNISGMQTHCPLSPMLDVGFCNEGWQIWSLSWGGTSRVRVDWIFVLTQDFLVWQKKSNNWRNLEADQYFSQCRIF